MPRTYTHFFTEDDLGNLPAMLSRLAADWDERCSHIAAEVAEQGRQRLVAVELAVARLTDRVAE